MVLRNKSPCFQFIPFELIANSVVPLATCVTKNKTDVKDFASVMLKVKGQNCSSKLPSKEEIWIVFLYCFYSLAEIKMIRPLHLPTQRSTQMVSFFLIQVTFQGQVILVTYFKVPKIKALFKS